MIISKFKDLHNNNHNPTSVISSTPKIFLMLIYLPHSQLYLQLQATANLLSISMNFPFLDILDK